MDLLRAAEPVDAVPNRLLSLLEDLDRRFGDLNDPAWDQLRVAEERGEETANVVFEVPPPAAAAARELGAMMSEVDEFCRSGDHLMTLATPPEIVSFRQWLIDEFTRQIDHGAAPRPWHGQLARTPPSPGDSATLAPAGTGSETIVFEGSLDLATVGGLRDTIQEMRSRNPGEIVVDLTNVGFVDSIGIGLLITTHTRLAEEGVALRLIVSPRLRELLRLSGLIDLLAPEDPAPGT
jgi:anti-anti-sigma factor